MSWRWFFVMCVACGGLVLGVGFGCGTSKPPLANGDLDKPGILTGPCSPEGATHICSTDLGVENGVHNCFAGTQRCDNGLWGPCTGSRTLSAAVSAGDLRLVSSSSSSTPLRPLATPLSDASGCASNPCDPSCLGFDQDAGNTCTSTTYYAGTLATPGIANSEMLGLQVDKTNWGPGSWKRSCDLFSTNNAATANPAGSCQLDSYCNPGTQFCNAFLPGQNLSAAVCLGGPDLVLGVMCAMPLADAGPGELTVPICNRGTAPVPLGTVVTVTEWTTLSKFPLEFDQPVGGGSSNCTPPTIGGGLPTGTCLATSAGCPDPTSLATLTGGPAAATCTLTLPAALPPGQCVDIANTANCAGGLTANGYLWLSAPVTECPLDNGSGAKFLGCSDNLSFAQVSPAPPLCVPIVQITGGSCLNAGGILGGTGGYTSLPGGWQQNEDPCTVSHRAAPAGSDTESDCSYDMCCPSNGANCVPWPNAPPTGACTPCTAGNAIDFTLGIGCIDNSADHHYAVCNRGTAVANAGSLRLGIEQSFPGGEHQCAPQSNSGKGACTIDLALNPIAPAACIDVDLENPAAGISCSGLSLSGNRSAFINEGSSPLAECDPCNNWGATTGQSCSGYSGLPPPASATYVYTAICPTGTRPQWKNLAYSVVTPTTSDVLFSVQAADFDDGGIAAPLPVVPLPAANPPKSTPAPATGATPWPQTCSFGGPTPCPVDLYKALGGPPLAQLPNLFLTITLTSTTAPATVNGWNVTYDCVASE